MLGELSHRGRSLSPDFHLPRFDDNDVEVGADDDELDQDNDDLDQDDDDVHHFPLHLQACGQPYTSVASSFNGEQTKPIKSIISLNLMKPMSS